MSHSHSHAPGESHSHGPAPQQPSPVPGQTQQQQAQLQQQIPQPDPALLAIIEQDFKPVKLKLGAPKESKALCADHGLEKCDECGVDFVYMNAISKIFVDNPAVVRPPPPGGIQMQRTQAVTKLKDEGNVLFKKGQHQKAIEMYTMAANIAADRLPWEPNQLMKDELGNILSNRSASYGALGDHISALADADVVVQVKRPWSKGYFRKAKALVELGDLEGAMEEVKTALLFEPENAEMQKFLDALVQKGQQS